MYTSEIKYRVLYAHTDKMNVVYYGRYYEYFEAGRNDMLRELGYPYTEMENENIALPVIESFCKYHLGAKYDDLLTIKCILKEIPTVKIRIDYEIYSSAGLAATGYTVHAFVDAEKMKPTRPPAKLIQIIKERFTAS